MQLTQFAANMQPEDVLLPASSKRNLRNLRIALWVSQALWPKLSIWPVNMLGRPVVTHCAWRNQPIFEPSPLIPLRHTSWKEKACGWEALEPHGLSARSSEPPSSLICS